MKRKQERAQYTKHLAERFQKEGIAVSPGMPDKIVQLLDEITEEEFGRQTKTPQSGLSSKPQ